MAWSTFQTMYGVMLIPHPASRPDSGYLRRAVHNWAVLPGRVSGPEPAPSYLPPLYLRAAAEGTRMYV